MLDRFAPALFALLRSTGLIVAKYAAMHADPLTFVAARHALAALAFAGICLMIGAKWPTGMAGFGRVIFSGVFLHGLYLAAVRYAIGQGVLRARPASSPACCRC